MVSHNISISWKVPFLYLHRGREEKSKHQRRNPCGPVLHIIVWPSISIVSVSYACFLGFNPNTIQDQLCNKIRLYNLTSGQTRRINSQWINPAYKENADFSCGAIYCFGIQISTEWLPVCISEHWISIELHFPIPTQMTPFLDSFWVMNTFVLCSQIQSHNGSSITRAVVCCYWMAIVFVQSWDSHAACGTQSQNRTV